MKNYKISLQNDFHKTMQELVYLFRVLTFEEVPDDVNDRGRIHEIWTSVQDLVLENPKKLLHENNTNR